MCMPHDKNIKVRGGNLNDNFRDDVNWKIHCQDFNDISSGTFSDILILNLTSQDQVKKGMIVA